ncbi:glycosyltransferase [Clostridium estertheticum]|uniref:glycosyltransferase n=1 Tax=Clostridium estertheticum TaxID=238834 RepID=UPI001CF3CC81|nr:glycosyltransferase [Clostridium estertheticum]MCB2359028.1 glycosyltransferase [Clostridium estertheticum]
MDRVDVSIIIPVYNVEEFLPKCLDSVINQTIDNKEIIVINDGSTDNCYEIIKEYKKKFPELVIINQRNSGISETRNAGLKAARGEYIAFVDSDDFVELDMFDKMYKAATSANVDIVICNYILYKEGQGTQDSRMAQDSNYKKIEGIDKEGFLDKGEALKMFLLNDIKGYVWNKLHKRELFFENNISFPDFVVCEDTPVGFLLIANANKIYSMIEPLYYYRQRELSLTRTFSIKSIKDMIDGCYIMRDFITKNPLIYGELIDYYRVYLIKTLWAIHNKYFIQSSETGDKKYYSEFKDIVSKEVDNLQISEIIRNSKLTFKEKVNILLIKTKMYGLIFPLLYKIKNVMK